MAGKQLRKPVGVSSATKRRQRQDAELQQQLEAISRADALDDIAQTVAQLTLQDNIRDKEHGAQSNGEYAYLVMLL